MTLLWLLLIGLAWWMMIRGIDGGLGELVVLPPAILLTWLISGGSEFKRSD